MIDVAGVGAAGHMHEPAVAGPAGHPAGGGVLAAVVCGDQHLDVAADECLGLVPGDRLLLGDEPLVPLLDDGLGHLPGHRRGRRPGPLASTGT